MITSLQVSSILIEGTCVPSCPCDHECVIKLFDGREATAQFFSGEIGLLLKAFPSAEIGSSWELEHFYNTSSLDATAESLLTALFQKSVPNSAAVLT